MDIDPLQVQFDRPFQRLSAAQRAMQRSLIDAQLAQRTQLWVFGYGSLMWRPCYRPAQAHRAQAFGYVRELCIWTQEARGTPDRPGLGLGLTRDSQAICHGVAHRIEAADQAAALDALWEREMLTGIYEPKWIHLQCEAGPLQALAFTVVNEHPQYAGRIPLAIQAQIVAHARGELGSCLDYVANTLSALNHAGVDEPTLETVYRLARKLNDTGTLDAPK